MAAPIPMPKPDKKDDVKKEDAKKEEPKKDEARQPGDAAVPGVELMIQRMVQSGMDPQAAKAMVENMNRQMAQMRKQMHMRMPMMAGLNGGQQEGRLGVVAEKPSATLVEQLDLPRGQGLILNEVQPDSAAAKAGLKAHDILLELNGKTVPDDTQEFARRLEDIKADKAVDAVVLRKGKRETIKGLKLPEEAPAGFGFAGNFALQLPQVPLPAVPPLPAMPLLPNFAGGGAGGVLMTTFRNGDHFTTRYQEGSLILTVTGTVADGKTKVGEIHVQDNGKEDKYESVDKVPERYRDKVKNLIETSEKSNVKIEIKMP
jgi:hypothetical protein